jgi:hypothetical protein
MVLANSLAPSFFFRSPTHMVNPTLKKLQLRNDELPLLFAHLAVPFWAIVALKSQASPFSAKKWPP